MSKFTRRAILGTLAAAPLALPGIVRGQSSSAPITIGFLSDMTGFYRENGGPGNRVAGEMAVTDFGGTLLGRPVQVIQADDQNKPELASAIAREWLANDNVNLLADGAASSAALAVQEVAREKKRIYAMTGPIANTLIGKQCSPYGFQFSGNAYSMTKGLTATLTRQGGDTWFTIMPNYESGITMESDINEFTKASGGKLIGSVRSPNGTPDYSSYLLQAQASGAKIIAIGLAGQDLQNCIKQAAEFGIGQGGQRLATPILAGPDIFAIGQDVCKGLIVGSFFYWYLTPETTEFSKKFIAKIGKPPTQNQASAYFGVYHWLKAVKAANTLDADAVAVKMRELPVNDFLNSNVKVYDNGCVAYKTHLFEVKGTAQSKEKFDFFNVLGSLSAEESNPSPGQFGCPLIKT